MDSCSFVDLLSRLRDFWWAFQETWLRLYELTVPSGAAINGHAPAGGCLLAVCCDYRAMVKSDKSTIGLNEARFGLVAPFFLMETFVNTVGLREAEAGLTLAKLYSVNEAKSIGLIDEVVEDKQAAIDSCFQRLSDLRKCVPIARHLTKMALRQPTLDLFHKRRKDDVEAFVSMVMQDALQKPLGAYIASLKKK